ncbi:dienelactone hydrolase family protein [Corallococcus carmarthensis]|uniref:Dienelactone hydrolase family protein n=1 Tax=Corallococcus carmarthensis TaxID=2316728 RepID=A0A3A8K709_9BACT|nr:dienelactone hydrolase family protein [Corallococcus carmarthensis]NOK20379.1 dienelactone hydrolase family protein [Corallococcus carmarthensis]RKG98241.1 dienelactone hydrolase family protein [Corallococcus carmarthensis]
MQDVDIKTADGVMDAKLFQPEGAGPWPAVIMIPDAFGIRPVFEDMALRLAKSGFVVLMPNVFYREAPSSKLDLQGSFADEAFRKRLYGLIGALTPERLKADAGAELDFLARQPFVKGPKAGVAGYCFSGGIAVRMGADFPDRIGAVASSHGGRLATDAPDSPHRLVGKVKAELYFGHADQDSSMNADAIRTLEAALKDAGLKYRSELYPGAQHGYTVPGSPAFNAEAAETHWSRLVDLFGRTLKA